MIQLLSHAAFVLKDTYTLIKIYLQKTYMVSLFYKLAFLLF